MASKVVLMLCLVFAMVLLISSQVSARDLAQAEASNTADTSTTLDGRSGYNRGHGGGGGKCYHGRCCRYGHCRCCNYAGENKSAEFQGEPHN